MNDNYKELENYTNYVGTSMEVVNKIIKDDRNITQIALSFGKAYTMYIELKIRIEDALKQEEAWEQREVESKAEISRLRQELEDLEVFVDYKEEESKDVSEDDTEGVGEEKLPIKHKFGERKDPKNLEILNRMKKSAISQ